MSLSLAQLRAVDAVVRHGQISRAAQSLGVSQPSVSNQIQAFETTWKVRIFDRDGYTIRLLPSAEALIGQIQLGLQILQEIEDTLDARSQREARHLSLGFSAHRLIMPALAEFVRSHPDIKLSTQGTPTMSLIQALKKGDIHLASVSLFKPEPGFHNIELARRPLVIYGKKGHPLLQNGPLKLTDLHQQAMVLWNKQSGSRRRFGQLCDKADVTPIVSLEVNTIDVAYAAVAAGIGLGTAIEGEVLADDHIDVVRLDAPDAAIGHYLLCLKGAELRPQVAQFIEIAQTCTTA